MTIEDRSSSSRIRTDVVQPIYVAIDESYGMRHYADEINAWLPELHGHIRHEAMSVWMSFIAFSEKAELVMPMSLVPEIQDMPGTVSGERSGANFGSLFTAISRAIADDNAAFASRGVTPEAPVVLLLSLATPSDGHHFFRAHADLVEVPRQVRPLLVGVGFRTTNRRVLKLICHKTLEFGETAGVFSSYAREHKSLAKAMTLFEYLQARPDRSRHADRRAAALSSGLNKEVNLPQAGPNASHRATSPPCFISYASTEQVRATEFAHELEAQGIPTWMASKDVQPGADYAASIVDAIESCSAFIVLLSPESTSSEHCLRELNLAVEMKKRIIPIWLQEHELSRGFRYRLSTIQIVDRSRIGDVLPSVRSGD